ncbi:MAG: alcohol dehydrogenase catalytic domain-containing protein [Herpetosiphon sp.]
MQALVFDGKVHLAEVPEPDLVPGEALIAPQLAGICATDMQITRGYMHYAGILGHEFVGTVVDCADRSWVGERVVGEINASCRACPTCLRGDDPHCPDRTTLGIDRRNGTMAERFVLPIANLHRVPPLLSAEQALFTEPLAAALEILQQQHIHPAERVAVIGDGKLGLLVAQVLRLTGAEIMVIGHHPERWTLLEQQRIKVMHPSKVPETRTWDVVVDCTGSAAGLAVARQLLRSRGRLLLKSTYHGTTPFDLSTLVVDEITVIGSRCGPFAAALRMLERGLVETRPLLHAVYPLRDAEEAFVAAQGQLKVALLCEQRSA